MTIQSQGGYGYDKKNYKREDCERINIKLHKKERMEDLQNYGGRDFRKS